jgi:hypothetical protein
MRKMWKADVNPRREIMNMNMQHFLTAGVIAGTVLLTGCKEEIEKHQDHSYDAPAIHHPTNEIGAPVRNPAPEPRTDTVPSTGNQQTVGSGHK